MKAILFDFGGTIDTDGVHWSEKYRELYARFGIRVARQEFDAAFVKSERLLSEGAEIRTSTMYQTLIKQLTIQFAILEDRKSVV